MNEAVLLQSLHHPNVVPFVGITVMPRQLRLISKWMKHGDIVGYLKRNPEVSKVDLVRTSPQRCCTLLYLYRDCKFLFRWLKLQMRYTSSVSEMWCMGI
jgi:hypothetical protein